MMMPDNVSSRTATTLTGKSVAQHGATRSKSFPMATPPGNVQMVPTVTHKTLLVNQKKDLLKAKHEFQKYTNSTPTESHSPLGWTKGPDNIKGLKGIIINDWISSLLLLWPVGCVAHFYSWGDHYKFTINFLAMIPLAKILGDATEELAAGLNNDTVGGLLNATFGNAVEMILTVQTLRAGELSVVKGTLLGSILSNLLLVLGMAFLFGGLTPGADGKVRGKEQNFLSNAALINLTMLFLATASFALPTVFFSAAEMDIYSSAEKRSLTLSLSRWCSIYILSAYIAFLVFQLYTHIGMFSDSDNNEDEDEEGAEEAANLSPPVALALLFVTTCFVAASSEWLVDSIDGLVDEFNIGKAFIGIILLPIVGNACEHAGAVRMAMVEKVDITIGIAVGSSTQIGLFVVPFSVLVGWAIDRDMDLNFGTMNTTVMIFAVLIAFSIITDGAANWLEGYMLMVAYAVIATLFWFFPELGEHGL